MGDFLNEMAVMMSQTKTNVSFQLYILVNLPGNFAEKIWEKQLENPRKWLAFICSSFYLWLLLLLVGESIMVFFS